MEEESGQTENTGQAEGQSPDPASGRAGGQQEPYDFRAHLSDDIRNSPSLADIKDVNGLAKSYIHAQRLIGADRAKVALIPADDAPPEERRAFFQKLGAPENADGYQLPVDQIDFSHGLVRNEDMEKWYKSTAHELGMTQAQTKGLYEKFMNFSAQALQSGTLELERKRDETAAALKREFGAAYEQKMSYATAALKAYATPEQIAYLEETGLGSDPVLAPLFIAMAEAIGDDVITDRGGNGDIMTPAQAEAERVRLTHDSAFMKAYTTKSHPNHDYAVKRMTELFALQMGQAART